MKILVACEFSGRVRDAFIAKGHDAISCDLLPSDTPGPHYMGDVRDLLHEPWDMMVAFPPCTYLCVSGARWHSGSDRQRSALEFVQLLMNAEIPRIAIENPVGAISSHIRKPDQIVHPWQFGHGETKTTCLWLKGLPKLIPTQIVDDRNPRIHRMTGWNNPDRSRLRSLTYPGIATAMADQWSSCATPSLPAKEVI